MGFNELIFFWSVMFIWFVIFAVDDYMSRKFTIHIWMLFVLAVSVLGHTTYYSANKTGPAPHIPTPNAGYWWRIK